MTDLHRIHHLRPLDDETPCEPDPIVTAPPEYHLQWLLMEVAKNFEQGEWTRGLDNLAHSVYVAATKGTQGLSDHELLGLIRKVVGHEFTPGEAA